MTLSLATNSTVSNASAITEKVADTNPITTSTFYHSDQIGSTEITTDSAGWPTSSETYYPFGEEASSISPTNHYKFTGKERDTESGNDYFGARYYASSMGRMLSPDPSQLFYADPTNPQSLNLYSYAQNNPLKNIDPTGLDCATQNADNTVSYNAGDCENGSQGGDANKEYYIDCDGCTSGAAGATLDSATGALYATDANGNAIAGTTVQGWADPQGVSTDIEVNGNNQIVGGGGYGAAGFLNPDPYANLPMLPNLSVRDPNAPPSLPKLKGKDKGLCLWGSMTNEMLGGDSGPTDSSDTAPGKGGAEPIPFHTTTRGGKAVTRQMGVNDSADAKAGGVVEGGNYVLNVLACLAN
jgi:RHS repeat-associated protein